MNTLKLNLEEQITISRYWLLDKDLLLLVNEDQQYAIIDFSDEDTIRAQFQPLPTELQLKNLRLSVALPYFALAEDFGQKGLILSVKDKAYQHLFERGNYQVSHCSFPLALYKKEELHYLLYGSDWNRVEQFCLETEQQLIPEYKEENDEKDLDYFHSSIQLSPNKKEFLSNGWVWQPFDIICRFKLDDLQKGEQLNFQAVQIPLTTGYNWDRPLCWINNNLIAIGYNPREDEEETHAKDIPSEILIYDLTDDSISKKIPTHAFALTDYGEVMGDLYYHKKSDAFICLNDQTGLYIISRNGQILHQSTSFKTWQYAADLGLFYSLNLSQELALCPIEALLP